MLSPTDKLDNNIVSQKVGEDSSKSPRSTSPSPPPVAINPIIAKIKLKKYNQCRNQKLKKPMHNELKDHRNMLSDEGFMNDEHLSDLISSPSFSGMHSLLEGLSIVMFNRTHCTKDEFGYIHRSHGCWIILGTNMFILWHEGTLHSRAKSRHIAEADDIEQAATLLPNVPSSANERPTGEVMLTLHRTDLKLLFYCWKETSPQLSRRTSRYRQAYDTSLHRLVNHICPLFEQKSCHQYLKNQTVIDLRPIIGYQSGEKIIGCLKTLGWIV